MQTWNLSWLFTNIMYFIVCYWSLLDNLHLCSPFSRASGAELPIPAKSCHGTSKAFANLSPLRRWRHSWGSPVALLQSCDNSWIIAKKKQTMNTNQAARVVTWRAVVLELLLQLLLRLLCKWFKEENVDLTTNILCANAVVWQRLGWSLSIGWLENVLLIA